LILGIKLG